MSDLHPELKVGSVWRDNDPRYSEFHGHERLVKVHLIYPSGTVRIECGKRMTDTKASRFGKKGRIGFTLVSSANPSTPQE